MTPGDDRRPPLAGARGRSRHRPAAPPTGRRRGRRARARGPRRRRPDAGRGRLESRRAAAASRERTSSDLVASSSGCPRGLGLDERDQPELGDEPVVVGGELAVDAAGEGVGGQRALQVAGRVPAPALALREPREGAGGREPADRLGDDVVVRGRPAAAERRQVLLVPARSGRGPGGCPRRGRRPPASRRAGAGSRPSSSAGPRARSRSSSGRRTGTGSRPTTSAAGPRRHRRSGCRP